MAALFTQPEAAPPPTSAAVGGQGRGILPRRGRGFRGVALAFTAQLDELLRVIAASQPVRAPPRAPPLVRAARSHARSPPPLRQHFVRCIKPNADKAPRRFDQPAVLRQLRCGGVLEAVRVFAAGYPHRMLIPLFVGRYRAVVPRDPSAAGGGVPPSCDALLSALGVSRSSYAIGKSKLFFRAGVLAQLEAARDRRLAECAARCQAAIRGRAVRRWSAEALLVAREEREAAAREAERLERLAALAAEQHVERQAARAAADARRAARAAEEEAVRVVELATAAAAAAEEEAAAASRRAATEALEAQIVSNAGTTEDLRRQIASLRASLHAAEEAGAKARADLLAVQEGASARERELRAEVARWREEAGLLETIQRQQEALAAAQRDQLRDRLQEKAEEARLYRFQYQQLALLSTTAAGRAPSHLSHARATAALGGTLAMGEGDGGDGDGGGGGGEVRRGTWWDNLFAKDKPKEKRPASAAATLKPVAATPIASSSIRIVHDSPRTPSPRLPAPGDTGTKASMGRGAVVSALRTTTPALTRHHAQYGDVATAREASTPSLGGDAKASLIREYQQYLGLHPVRDAALLWVAEEAARAPLPPGWALARDPAGEAYYANDATGQSSREHPRDDEFRALIAQGRLDRMHAPTPQATAGPPHFSSPQSVQTAAIAHRAATQRGAAAAAAASPLPSAGDWSTMAMRTVEQTLCAAAAGNPVRAAVRRLATDGTAAVGGGRFSFDLSLADELADSMLVTVESGSSGGGGGSGGGSGSSGGGGGSGSGGGGGGGYPLSGCAASALSTTRRQRAAT